MDPDARHPFDLDRFVQAQDSTYDRALGELRAGAKRSHWMWYIFPQIEGLGTSPAARKYAIRDRAEAQAYLNHAILGPRLIECCRAVLGVTGRSARQMLGWPDDLKLRSCVTLFAQMSREDVFQHVLDKYYDGKPDEETLKRLQP